MASYKNEACVQWYLSTWCHTHNAGVLWTTCGPDLDISSQQREGQCANVHKFVHCLGMPWVVSQADVTRREFLAYSICSRDYALGCSWKWTGIVPVHFQKQPKACPSSVHSCALTFPLLWLLLTQWVQTWRDGKPYRRSTWSHTEAVHEGKPENEAALIMK